MNEPLEERKITMTDKTKKLSLKDNLQAIVAGVGIVGGLFAFALILGIIFMDYDPMTMVNGIKSEFEAIFS